MVNPERTMPLTEIPNSPPDPAEPPLGRAEQPAAYLAGEGLANGWQVEALIERALDATGGNFSVSYRARRRDDVAFVKALDLSPALSNPDPTAALQSMTAAYEHERKLVQACGRLDRVVHAIADGVIVFPENKFLPVPYLIFEYADGGDVRAFLKTSEGFDIAWKLKSLHQAAVGMMQLHKQGIAHQDLKPSNVMVFTTRGSKVGDLGCASEKGGVGPSDRLRIAGDPVYAAPELLYGEVPVDWTARRLGTDLYLLGSLVMFYFTDATMTALIEHHVAPTHHWRTWGGTYRDVLPFIRQAFDDSLLLFNAIPAPLGAELATMVRYLCDPEPERRGHPKNRRGAENPLALDRFVAQLNLLYHKAEHKLLAEL